MSCPACIVGGLLGGWVGGYFGINPPQQTGARIVSGLFSASLMFITLVALKKLFNVTLCGGESTRLSVKFARVALTGVVLGTLYSIAVNYLLGRYVFVEVPPNSELCLINPGKKCGCKNLVQGGK